MKTVTISSRDQLKSPFSPQLFILSAFTSSGKIAIGKGLKRAQARRGRRGEIAEIMAMAGETTRLPLRFHHLDAERPAQYAKLLPKTSEGMAAGACFEDAAYRAICERIERAAALIWWAEKTRPLAISREHLNAAGLHADISLLRQSARSPRPIALYLLDEIYGVQTALALSVAPDQSAPSIAFAADLCPIRAARSALIELGLVEIEHLRLAYLKDQEPDEWRTDPYHQRAQILQHNSYEKLKGNQLQAFCAAHVNAKDGFAYLIENLRLAQANFALRDFGEVTQGNFVVRALFPDLPSIDELNAEGRVSPFS